MNDLLWASPRAPGLSHFNNMPTAHYQAFARRALMDQPAPPPILGQFYLYANATARAAVIEDSTLMSTSNGGFLTSAIPVPGEPFFGAPAQDSVSASGSVVELNGISQPWPTNGGGGSTPAVVNARLVLSNATLRAGSLAPGQQAVALQMVSFQWRRIFVGLAETAFADTTALPSVFDVTGPTARVTALNGGTGTGNARLSYTWLTPSLTTTQPGWTSLLSVEQPVAEIQSGVINNTQSAAFSRYPDFVSTTFYSNGYTDSAGSYQETFHLQASTVIRSLGVQSADESIVSSTVGWGESVSGMVAVPFTSGNTYPDALVASYTVGQGIAHYIVDLQTPTANLSSGGNDAFLNGANSLVALPVSAWYVGFMHNWTNSLQSCLTYSHTSLQSFTPNPIAGTGAPPPASPFRRGDYVQINLQRTRRVRFPSESGPPTHYLQYGIEYIYGQKQTLDGNHGHDHRGLFVVSLTQ